METATNLVNNRLLQAIISSDGKFMGFNDNGSSNITDISNVVTIKDEMSIDVVNDILNGRI